MTAAAVLFAALAGGLLVGPVGTRRRGIRLRIPDRGSGRWLLGCLAGAAVALLVWLDGLRLVLALILLGCTAGGVAILRRARTRKVAERRRASIVEVCEALVGELRAGQPLVASLERCVEVWPEFEPVVAAGRLGADVPGALRRLALLPGAEGLREVASAWQVSERSGSGLSSALGQVAGSARARQSTRHLVSSELASAQATARLVAVLPLAALAMSSGIGGHPWHFLLATPIGLGCLAVGAASAFSGLWWIDRIAVQVLRA